MDQTSESEGTDPQAVSTKKKPRSALYRATVIFAVLWVVIGIPGVFILIFYGDRMLHFIGVQLFGSLAILCFVLLLLREAIRSIKRAIADNREKARKGGLPIDVKSGQVANLERLWALKESGAITELEYNSAKSKLLDQITSG